MRQVVRLIGPTVEVLNDEGFLLHAARRLPALLQIAAAGASQGPGNPYVAANLRLLQDAYRGHKAVQ